jgi:hypothetical protein
MGDDTNAEVMELKARNEWLVDELAAARAKALNEAATELLSQFPKSDTVASIAVWLRSRV